PPVAGGLLDLAPHPPVVAAGEQAAGGDAPGADLLQQPLALRSGGVGLLIGQDPTEEGGLGALDRVLDHRHTRTRAPRARMSSSWAASSASSGGGAGCPGRVTRTVGSSGAAAEVSADTWAWVG